MYSLIKFRGGPISLHLRKKVGTSNGRFILLHKSGRYEVDHLLEHDDNDMLLKLQKHLTEDKWAVLLDNSILYDNEQTQTLNEVEISDEELSQELETWNKNKEILLHFVGESDNNEDSPHDNIIFKEVMPIYATDDISCLHDENLTSLSNVIREYSNDDNHNIDPDFNPEMYGSESSESEVMMRVRDSQSSNIDDLPIHITDSSLCSNEVNLRCNSSTDQDGNIHFSEGSSPVTNRETNKSPVVIQYSDSPHNNIISKEVMPIYATDDISCLHEENLSSLSNVIKEYSNDDNHNIDPNFNPEMYESESSESEVMMRVRDSQSNNIDDLPIHITDSSLCSNEVNLRCNSSTDQDGNIHFSEGSSPVINRETNKSVVIQYSEVQYFEKELYIPDVPHSKQRKKYFCYFCSKLIAKLPRHVENLHRDEEKVKEFLHLPKNSKERKDLIDKLRKEFLFIYNTNENVNKGSLIPSRQPQQKFNRIADNFKVCPNCKGFYADSAFRRHFRKCSISSKPGERDTLQRSRRVVGRVHVISNNIVRNKIFPVMRDDECVRCIRYDELVILFANKLTEKYRSQHNYSMIRSRLRLIGRLLIEMKKINKSIENFSQIFDPKVYDQVILACNKVAGFNNDDMKYRAPATAFGLGTLLKKCGKILINKCIRIENHTAKNRTKDFLKILEEEFSYSVNKTVQENQIMWKRQKQVKLPSLHDIRKLNSYLREKRHLHYKNLQTKFDFNHWKKLGEYTLISIQVFNRRRPGEIQRILVEDFQKFQCVDLDADKELFSSVSDDLLRSASDYVRFSIRGKLGKDVPVLLNREFLECVQILLRYRTDAEIPVKNPFLFALPGETSSGFKHLSACNLLKKFAYKCGAEKPYLLKATELRKHIATRSVMLNLQDQDVTDLARFMGHEKRIHEDHYRLPVASRDILKMSKFLENAQGEGNETSRTSISSSNQNPPLERSESGLVDCSNSSNGTRSNEDLAFEIDKCDDGNQNEIANITSRNNELTPNDHDATQKRKRMVSPKGYVKRSSWSRELKDKVMNLFKNYVDNGQLPPLDVCADAIKEMPELNSRSPVQLKAFISNQIKKTDQPKRNRRSTIYWTHSDKQCMRRIFTINLRTGKLPSLQQCQEAINNNPELECRSRETVKAWINNQIRRRAHN